MKFKVATMKFKEGDICIITEQDNGHEFEIGTEVVVTAVCPDDEDYNVTITNGNESYWVKDEELKLKQ